MPVVLTSTTRNARKRSATSVPKAAFEACYAHNVRLEGFQDGNGVILHDQLAQDLRSRRIHIPLLNMFDGVAPARRPNCTTDEARLKWLRDEILSTQDKNNGERSLRVSHTMLSKGGRSARLIGSEQQMLMWARFWDFHEKVTSKPACGGLGLFAGDAGLAVGTIVARGEIDNSLWWPELETLVTDTDGKESALFGPISLINAACSKHANVEFTFAGRTVSAKVTRKIHAGQEILAHYPCGGLKACVCWCEARIRKRRDADESA